MVGGSAVRAEAMNIMHRLAKIVLSLVLTMGLVPLVPDRALADGGLDDEALTALEGEGEIVAYDANEEPTTPELYDTVVADANCHQLVLIVRFAGDKTGDGATGLNAVSEGSSSTLWRGVHSALNGRPLSTYAAPSLYSYLKEVSKGRCRLQSVIPQMSADGETVAYLTLPASRDAYVAHSSVVEAAVDAFNSTYPDADFRSLVDDAAGFISNVLVIPETGDEAPAVGSTLWPRHDDYPGDLRVGAAGKSARVGSYTIVDTTHIKYTGTIIHEAIHAFGGRDLYRFNSLQLSNHAVGMWDIMAMNGASRLMRPLAVTLQDCGWTSIEEVGTGTHTLVAPSLSGRSAVKFKSPYSDSEYFVAEFRVANTDIGNLSALDTAYDGFSYTIGGTGLVVYRVNPSFRSTGNKGSKDYVYIFRPGEAVSGGVRGDGEGDLKHAQLSATGACALGSSDMMDGLADGAITLSDGSNSGLVVRVVSNDDSALTFELSVAIDAGGWSAVEATGDTLPLSGFFETKLVADGGKVYQLCSAFRSAPKLYCLEESSRTDLGSPDQSFGSFYAVDMVVKDGVVYLCGSDGARTMVWKRVGTKWLLVGDVPMAATAPVMGVVAGCVYLYVDNMGSNGALYRVDSGGVTMAGSVLGISRVYNPRVIEKDGAPAVVFSGDADTKVAWQAGGVWMQGTLHGGTSSSISTTECGGVTYVASSDGQRTYISSFAADGFFVTEEISGCLPKPYSVAVAARDNMLYLCVAEWGTQLTRVYKASAANLSNWELLGGIVVTSATSASIAVCGTDLFCATVATTEAPVGLRSFTLKSEVGGAPIIPPGSGGNGTVVPGSGDSSSSSPSGKPGTGSSSSGSSEGSGGSADSSGSGSGSGSGAGSSTLRPSGVWKKSGSRWWYRHRDGSYTRNGWELIDGFWYHFDSAGWMQTGWQRVGGAWYYLGGSGAMATGWAKVGGSWYYLKSSGAMATGWQRVGGAWYYLKPSGAMAVGWHKLGGAWYYLGGSGAMATGWYRVGSSWYYSNGSGAMQANRWIGNYYVTGSGAMAVNTWIGRYHVNASGLWDKTR